jgi:dihydroorotate dehydrogenase
MYDILRPGLFRLDPETAHHRTLQLLRVIGSVPVLARFVYRQFAWPAASAVEVFGLTFPNRVGLAAGYDKDGLAWRGLAALGFGHVEVGTVTPRPQSGNPKPRLFRLPEDRGLINRMGFPGEGSTAVAPRLGVDRPQGVVLGVNLGMNKDTPLDQAAGDYENLIAQFAPLADYLVVNVSSPNTVGLRRLQAREALDSLLANLMEQLTRVSDRLEKRVPLLVKLSPDLEDDELRDAVEVIHLHKLDGVVATNTTIARPPLQSSNAGEAGGLSGAPLSQVSTARVAGIHELTGGELPIIAVGGIMGEKEAREKLAAGAVLLQIYTGMIYRGPGIVKEILRGV